MRHARTISGESFSALFETWVAAALLAGSIAGGAPALAGLPPDAGLRARQTAALQRAASDTNSAARLTADHAYTTNRADAVRIGGDAAVLVARLELDRRRLPGGLSPRDASRVAANMAQALARGVGMGKGKGPWHWNNAGTPSISTAAGNLAYALHRYGHTWPSAVKESIRAMVQDATWHRHDGVHNAALGVMAAELLVGEALGNGTLWERGLANLTAMTGKVLQSGGGEWNAPLYTAIHFPPLLHLQALRHAGARIAARRLLEYELLLQGHLYLPGGGLGVPQSRDYAGGIADGGDRCLVPVLWLLVGDPEAAPYLERAYVQFLAAAATDYTVPETIRSIFLDKGDGYTFWTQMGAVHGRGRTPYSVYSLGLDGGQVSPWQCVMLPGGMASFGIAYGWTMNGHVSSGVYVRRPAGGFSILYQYQPNVKGDTDHTRQTRALGGTGHNANPDDFQNELYDYERLVHDRTLLMLWDPTTNSKPAGVVRTHPDTRVHLPDWAALGGEACRAGEWRVGRLGEVYIGYCPLGKVSVEESR
ncbi:MAG: hypothetical protein JXR37_32365, partial [Kiritimatiellae bacterium]|nr:hypothetical protein [Kiritimatiellia bacterium]